MRGLITILLFIVLIVGCNKTTNKDGEIIAELESLRAENDSLNRIISAIESKYVFDSISVRDIPSYKNVYEPNSKITGEIVFVGYNLNSKSWAITFDSINYDKGRLLINPDTLLNVNGGYKYEKVLKSDLNTVRADLKTENEYGRPFNVVYHTIIATDKP